VPSHSNTVELLYIQEPTAKMPRAIRGVLVVCDASIKSIIVKIDSEDHAFIVEELDDSTLVVKENMLSILKMRLDEILKETQQPPEDSGEE